MYFDAHSHLPAAMPAPDCAAGWRERSRLGLAGAVINGTGETDWAAVTALVADVPWLVPSYGLHPWAVGHRSPAWQAHLRTALATAPRAGVGEIGLDRWMLTRARPDDPRLAGRRRAPLPEQQEVFAWQLALAATENRAASIHCLDAWDLIFATLRTTARPSRGFLLHAYAGPAELVAELTALGAYFSFNGAFLDPRRARARAVFAQVPDHRLLVETDAPVMSPSTPCPGSARLPAVEGRGFNHTGNLAATYAGLAQLRGVPLATLTAQVAENFHRLFG